MEPSFEEEKAKTLGQLIVWLCQLTGDKPSKDAEKASEDEI